MPQARKRVLVVDDSVFARKIISDILTSSPRLEVVGLAVNGLEALAKIGELNPDVVTLDVEMPALDGLETLRRIMREHPTPVVMLSSLTARGAKESITALTLGAVDVMAKPHGSHSIGLGSQADELIAKVIAAAEANVSPLATVGKPRAPVRAVSSCLSPVNFPVVIIASSTGGPRALRQLMPQLDASLGAAYVLVQHLPDGFSGPMAHDLNTLTQIEVRETEQGDLVRSGVALLARSGYHCVIESGGRISLARTAPLWGVRPAADITIASAVPVYGNRLVGVVLTGMGCDGADGLRMIGDAGGATIAEHESTCVVYGMPRVAIERGYAHTVAPLSGIAGAIATAVASRSRRASERDDVGPVPHPQNRANRAA